MGIMNKYAKNNQEQRLNNHIVALKRLIEQQGEKSAFYILYKAELEKAEQKLKQMGVNCGREKGSN